MGWINDIKVSFKILILAVIAAVALVSVGYTGYSMLDQANYRIERRHRGGARRGARTRLLRRRGRGPQARRGVGAGGSFFCKGGAQCPRSGRSCR